MTRTSTWFKFEPPADWGESNENGRLVYRSPSGEVLMVSTATLSGQGSVTEEESARDKFFGNAVASVIAAATQADLRITQNLRTDERVQNLECWTLEALTHDESELFFQSIFRHGPGILLVTFEAFNSIHAKSAYQRFIQSVGANG